MQVFVTIQMKQLSRMLSLNMAMLLQELCLMPRIKCARFYTLKLRYSAPERYQPVAVWPSIDVNSNVRGQICFLLM